MHSSVENKMMKDGQKQSLYEARFKKRFNETQRREHEDSLKFFQVWKSQRHCTKC